MKHKNDLTFNAKFNGKERFGFRKLSIGLVTVALGTTFFLSNGQLVHADENNNQEPTSTEVEGATQSEEKQEVKVETQQTQSKETTPKNDDASETSDAIQSTTPKTDGATQGNTLQNSTKEETTNTLGTSSLETKKANKTTLTDQKDDEKPADEKQPSYTSDVKAYKNQDTSVDVKNSTQKLYADQDAVEVDTTVTLENVDHVTHDNPIKVQIVNSVTKETSNVLHINDTINNDGNWHFEKDGDFAFNAWYEGNELPKNVTFKINVQARNQDVKAYLKDNPNESSENIPIGVKITYPTGKTETKHVFNAQFIPSKDIIKKSEILKGFRMGTTTIDKEKGYGNITPDDITHYGLDNNKDTVLQWGLYFNYSGSLDPNKITTLENAIFSATFNNQIFLPNSIKIFKVPAKYVSDGNGTRYGIDDIPAGETDNVYKLITTTEPQDTVFEKYLRDNSNGNGFAKDKSIKNGFAIDQSTSGAFYVPKDSQNDTNYSHYAYFIQVDTVVPSKHQGDGSISLQTFQGTGETRYSNIIHWNSSTNGSGEDTKNVQQAILKYYDDDTNSYLNIDNQSSDISINGTDGEIINFGFSAQNNYDHFINANYIYSEITRDSEKGDVLTSNGSKVSFATTDIFSKFDNINDHADGTDSHPQVFVVHFTHKISKSITTEKAAVREHVSYYYENGTKKGQQVSDQYAPTNSALHFIRTRTDTTDLVTNSTQTTWSNWALDPSKDNSNNETSFKEILLPSELDDNYKLDLNGKFIVDNNTGKQFSTTDGKISTISFTNNEITDLPKNALISIQVPYKQPDQQAILRYYDDDTKSYLNINNNQSSDVSIIGTPGDTINFGTLAQNNYNHFTNANYKYSRITKDSETGDTLTANGSNVSFATSGIYSVYDNSTAKSDGTDSHPQIFVVHFKHGTKDNPVSQTTTVTENVSYYYENGPKAGQNVPNTYAPKNYELTFTRTGTETIDSVTGKSIKTTWNKWKFENSNDETSFKEILFSNLPQELDDNYKLDPNGTFKVADTTGKKETEQLLIIKGKDGKISAISFSDDDITALSQIKNPSITIQVPYSYTPIQPSQPTQSSQPTQPSQQPSQPTSTVITPKGQNERKSHNSSHNTKVNTPKGTKTVTNTTSTITPKGTRKRTFTSYTSTTPKGQTTTDKVTANTNKQNTLPQTGEKQTNLSVLGLGIIALAGLFGLGYDKKRKN